MTLIQPFFSIVIPAYNRAYILPATISSIQEQSFTSWELIVVDDGSNDNTRGVIERISLKDTRIRYVYQENAERSVARNHGADLAVGHYILFLDSDDAFLPNHLTKLYSLLESENFPVGLVFSNVTYLTENGYSIPKIPLIEKGKEFEYMLLQPITPSRVCLHKSVLNTFRFDPLINIVEDMVLWVCIASKYPVFQLTEPSAVYRIHEDNSVNLSRNSYLKRYKGLNRLFNHSDYAIISSLISTKIKRHLLAECAFNMARHFEYTQNYFKMNQMLFLSFKHLYSYRNKERLYMSLSNLPILGALIRSRSKS
jgi:glycosyltransferase involved in cell wall biosynthesis